MSHAWAEVYRSDRTLVERDATSPRKGAVVRTVRPGPDARRRVAHEVAMLHLLRGVHGVPQLLNQPAGTELLVEDVGGMSLADLVAASHARTGTPWRFVELLDLAASLTSVIAEVHRRGVVHRDISPANVVVHGPDRQPVLIDFELAVSLTEVWQEGGRGTRSPAEPRPRATCSPGR